MLVSNCDLLRYISLYVDKATNIAWAITDDEQERVFRTQADDEDITDIVTEDGDIVRMV
jgi:hypothetical protein